MASLQQDSALLGDDAWTGTWVCLSTIFLVPSVTSSILFTNPNLHPPPPFPSLHHMHLHPPLLQLDQHRRRGPRPRGPSAVPARSALGDAEGCQESCAADTDEDI